MQDGIFHRKVSVFSCNRENCDFLYSKLLTSILRSAILKLLGQSEKTAFQCVKKNASHSEGAQRPWESALLNATYLIPIR